jgi:outer membrane protein OmpA-like peptidoglycan-associated protein
MTSVLNRYPDTDLRIIGYTDSTGQLEFNRKLSERRAGSVRDYLASQGIAADRMTSRGEGVSHPVADNRTEEGRARNRRVEIWLLAGERMIREAQQTAGK